METRNILMHPAIGRAMSGGETSPALALLVRARLRRRDHLRARANAREEVEAGVPSHWITDVKQSASNMSVAVARLLNQALQSDGLPEELRAPITEYVSVARSKFGDRVLEPTKVRKSSH